MTRVFVHGVPETSLVWDELREQVGGDSVALPLPGFGVPLPDDFVPGSRCILGLYRSAIPNVGADWGARAQTPTSSPGLVLIATGDRVDNETAARATAERLGALVAVLPGGTHFWMFDSTGTVASVLSSFWSSLP